MRYELRIRILDEKYVDQLIVSLARQGYDVYMNPDEAVVCCTITDDELVALKDK